MEVRQFYSTVKNILHNKRPWQKCFKDQGMEDKLIINIFMFELWRIVEKNWRYVTVFCGCAVSIVDNRLIQCYSMCGPWTITSEASVSLLEVHIFQLYLRYT